MTTSVRRFFISEKLFFELSWMYLGLNVSSVMRPAYRSSERAMKIDIKVKRASISQIE